MPPDTALAAIRELRQRRLISVAERTLVVLVGGVRSNLWGWERESMRGTEWDEYSDTPGERDRVMRTTVESRRTVPFAS